MRATVLFLAAVLLPAPAAAQLAWARDYDDGVELFKKGTNDALAEQKLIQARDHPRAPDQSRKATFSSTYIKPFIPDYYLGLIAERRGEYAKAQRLLEGALQRGLVRPGDSPEYAAATAGLQRARDGEARLAGARRPPPVETKPSSTQPTQTASNQPTTQPSGSQTQPSGSTTATPVRPPPNTNTVTPPATRPVTTPQPPVEPAWLASFRRAMEAARLSLSGGRYTEARGTLSAARGLAGDAVTRQAVDSLAREIDAAQSAAASRIVERARSAIRRKEIDTALTQVAALEKLSPGHVAIGELRNGVDRLRGELRGIADLARAERTGVKLFLSGNYKDSAAELERAIAAGVTSPRIYLFLASSHAAQALLAPEAERPALVEEARRTYALAKPGESGLATDRKFISPSILKLLDGG